MIKFFRKIRQRLLTENKFSKYFLYAIGEISLVVIGILIALQVNDWNNNRKNLDLEDKILKEIKIGKGDHYPIARIINSKVDTTCILGIN